MDGPSQYTLGVQPLRVQINKHRWKNFTQVTTI